MPGMRDDDPPNGKQFWALIRLPADEDLSMFVIAMAWLLQAVPAQLMHNLA